jgi:RimJ/RimL family protein N-acetyltransferase
MDLQPTMTGKLLRLRPLASGDFEALYASASDPLVWEQHPESSRYQRDVFRKFFDGAMASKGAFAILDASTGEIIGSSRYYDFAEDRREVAIGFTFLARKFWGGVYNRELKSLMLSHAFKSVDSVIFHVGARNFRSQKALEKIGAALAEKIMRPGANGQPQETFVYILRKNDPGAQKIG